MIKILRFLAKYYLIPASLVWVLHSCTVKEDRTDCPCFLEVLIPEKDLISAPVILTGWTTEEVFLDRLSPGRMQDAYTYRVPRTMLHFSAFEGVSECIEEKNMVTVPLGSQCDSLYAFIDLVDCTGETASTTVHFHKQFATVTLQIVNESFPSEDYSFAVSSGSSGLDMLSLQAVPGNFSYQPRLDENKRMSFRLPRQGDDSLSLSVTHISGDSVLFPLGRYISDSGYDWDATDLKDIYISLDIARNYVTIGVAGWENAGEFEQSTIEM